MRKIFCAIALMLGCRGMTAEPTASTTAEPVASMDTPTVRRRALEELVVEDDALRGFLDPILATTEVDVIVVPPDRPRSSASLERLQVTTHSTLGALVYQTGGLVVDHGWLRIIGGPTDAFPFDPWSLAEALELAGDDPSVPAMLVVAIDRVGGVFALDGGALGRPGRVSYFAPDTLEWEPLDTNHSQLVASLITAREREFYADLRWSGWEAEVAGLTPVQGISVYPPLWTAESRPRERTSRAPVPLLEVASLGFDFARQLRSR